MFRQAAARGTTAPGPVRGIQCRLKLESSTTSTSYGSGSRTASSGGTPMFPTDAARLPAALSR